MEEQQCGLREAARTVGCSVSSLGRAKIAMAEDRNIGARGRPKILNIVEEERLISAIIEADEKQSPLTYHKLREVVFSPLRLFYISFKHISLQ
jgi:hypothetical protein